MKIVSRNTLYIDIILLLMNLIILILDFVVWLFFIKAVILYIKIKKQVNQMKDKKWTTKNSLFVGVVLIIVAMLFIRFVCKDVLIPILLSSIVPQFSSFEKPFLNSETLVFNFLDLISFSLMLYMLYDYTKKGNRKKRSIRKHKLYMDGRVSKINECNEYGSDGSSRPNYGTDSLNSILEKSIPLRVSEYKTQISIHKSGG